MKTLLKLALGVILLATPAAAVVDPTPDGVGVYFDTTGDTYEITWGQLIPFPAYVTLTNPSRTEMTGFEFAYALDTLGTPASALLRLQILLPPGVICITCTWDPIADNVRVVWATPVPTAAATVMMSWEYLMLMPMQVDVYLAATPFTGPDSGQIAYQAGGEWVPLHISSGDPSLPVASVNGTAIDVLPAAFGSVKALYH